MPPLYYIYNKNGDKISVTGKELQELTERGIITPDTLIEVEGGKTVWAKGIKGLTFKSTAVPQNDEMETRIAEFLNEPIQTKPTSKATDAMNGQSVSLTELQRQSAVEWQREQELERAALLERQREVEAKTMRRKAEVKATDGNGNFMMRIGQNCRKVGCSLFFWGFFLPCVVGFIWGLYGLHEGFLPIVWIVVGLGSLMMPVGFILLIVGWVIPKS